MDSKRHTLRVPEMYAAAVVGVLILLLPMPTEASYRYVITFREGTLNASAEFGSVPATEAWRGALVDKWYGRRIIIRFEQGAAAQRFVESVTGLMEAFGDRISSVEEDLPIYPSADVSSTSLLLAQSGQPVADGQQQQVFQWAMDPGEPSGMFSWIRAQDFLPNRQAPNASGNSTFSQPPIVAAVLDSGISESEARGETTTKYPILQGYDFITDPAVSLDGDGRDINWLDPGDAVPGMCETSSWHGTMTSMLLAFKESQWNRKNFTGVAPNQVQLLPVRVLGACRRGFASDVADAIVWAAGGDIRGLEEVPEKTARIIVMPFSGYSGQEGCPSYLQSAVALAASKNITLVASAGNSYGQSVSNYFPANCKGVLSVGALDRSGKLASYSSVNADLFLPGGDSKDPLACMSAGGAVRPCVGTSFAAVHAAGWAAIVMQSSINNQFPPAPPPTQAYTQGMSLSSGTMSVTGDAVDLYYDKDEYMSNRYDSNRCDKFFWFKTTSSNGWQTCPYFSCQWKDRDIPGSHPVQWDNRLLDEFCVCIRGFYAIEGKFTAKILDYRNDDARPVGYCYRVPAAYDKFECTRCLAEHFCPGGGYYDPICDKYPGCDYPDCTYITHQPAIPCRTCEIGSTEGWTWGQRDGRFVIVRGNCTETQNRWCLFCLPGETYSTEKNSRECQTCRGPCASDEYETVACTTKTNRRCEKCTVCNAGEKMTSTCRQIMGGNRQCVKCDPGTYTDVPNQNQCTDCGAGKYLKSTGGSGCVSCPNNDEVPNAGRNDCEKCKTGEFARPGFSICLSCNSLGSYWNRPQGLCLLCNAGTYVDSSVQGTATICKTCDLPKTAVGIGQSECKSCGVGMFAKDTTLCVECEKGKYWGPDNETRTGGASLECISCLPGTFAEGNRAQNCLKCEIGTYSGLAWSSCIACTRGSMVLKDASGCEACPAGQYSTVDKATACIKCAKGKFISTPGATTCTNCTAGTYADEDGLNECKKCPTGKFSTAVGSSSNTSCRQCTGRGYTPQDGQTVCSNCLADYAVSLGHRGESLTLSASFLTGTDCHLTSLLHAQVVM